jgi:hypothetical protein
MSRNPERHLGAALIRGRKTKQVKLIKPVSGNYFTIFRKAQRLGSGLQFGEIIA